MKWADGTNFDGNWDENVVTGHGTFNHANGDVFEGQFLNNQANGYGKYTHKDGAYYEGYWKNDTQHTEGDEIGYEYWKDGSRYVG